MSVLTGLVLPSGAAFALFFLGLLLACWRRTHELSWATLALSGLMLLVFSSGKVAALLASPLEYAHETIQDPRLYPQAKHIVVLTGWASHDPLLPLSGRMNASSAYRVLMALELHRDRPDCDIVISGSETAAHVMAEVIAKLGVPRDKIRLEDRSTSTAQSAELLASFVDDDPFFLVTSAGHMPRSLAVMRRQRLNAIPVPTEHLLPKDWRRAEWRPSPESLAASDLAVHEYLGRLWYHLHGIG